MRAQSQGFGKASWVLVGFTRVAGGVRGLGFAPTLRAADWLRLATLGLPAADALVGARERKQAAAWLVRKKREGLASEDASKEAKARFGRAQHGERGSGSNRQAQAGQRQERHISKAQVGQLRALDKAPVHG